MEGLPDAAAFATKLKNTLIQYHSIEDDKWRVAKKTRNVTIWRKPSEEFNGYLFKAQGIIDGVVNDIMDHIRPGPCRLDWDSLMTSLDILENFEENCCVMRYTTAGQLWNIISPREFVDFSYTVDYNGGLLSCGFKMTNEEPLPKKVRLSETDFKVMARDELILRWKQYEAYVQALEGKYTDLNSNDVTGLRESEEKLKQQQQESARRENILVMRLATKEQEMQECTTQIQYLKQVQQPSVAQLRSTMVDPAINLFFLKMKGELEQTKDKLEQAQNELSAWKFTPDSQTGKKLMAKCRMLIQENQELGRQLSQGRIAQLEAELALQKKYSEELKSSQDELNDFIIQLDEEVEGMQSTILVLQQQLKETRQQLAQYQQQQAQAPAPSTSRTTSSEPVGQAEAPGKDCSRLANGPSNGSSSRPRTSGSGCHREGDTTEDGFPSSPGNGNKASNSSEERTGKGGSSYVNQLSAGYESVDSPTGSENSLTHHLNDTDSNHDPQEEKTVSGKGNRTAGSRHIQNGLDSSVNVQGSVL